MSRHLASLAFAAAVVALGALAPALASAADFYVNDDGGNDANACTTTTAPCATIAVALNRALNSAGIGDTVNVDGGSYTANDVILSEGNSLVEFNFDTTDGDTEAVITGGSNGGAILVPSSASAGTISRFDFVHAADGFGALITLNGDATVNLNSLSGLTSASNSGIQIGSSSDAIVSQNSFTSSAGGIGVSSTTTGSLTISMNSFSGTRVAIDSSDGLAEITQNVITGTADPGDFSGAVGIAVSGGTATVTRNTVSDADPAAFAGGIEISDADTTSGPEVTATLARNLVSDQFRGFRVADSSVDMNSDLAFGNRFGLSIFGDTPTSVDAENVTLYDNDAGTSPADIQVSSAELTLNSAIVEKPIVENGSTCTIEFSRGPTTSGTGCQQFQTTALPGFVDPAAGDYHLAQLSPLIDAGDPATPIAPNTVDIDGDPRVRNGDCQPTAIRDMGSDEAGPRLAECDPPETVIDSGPSGTTADSTPTFTFSSDEPGSSFECRVDAAPFAACSGPGASHTAAPLAAGPHSFEVRAIDPVGNVDPTPASRGLTVAGTGAPPATGDVDPPETEITKAPKRKLETAKQRAKAKLRFESDEPGSSFECKLDKHPYKPCDSGRFKARVKVGKHKFRVRAVDVAGNADPTPDRARWRVVRG